MAEVLELTMRLVLEFVFEIVFHGVGRSVRWLLRWPPPAHPDADCFIGSSLWRLQPARSCSVAHPPANWLAP